MQSQLLSKTLIILTSIFLVACANTDVKELPYIGQHQYENGDTILYTIPPFDFTNTDNQSVTNADLANYIYISDFFFTRCPTICPKVKKQMLRVYKKYKENDHIRMVSHTLDPKRDSIPILKKFAGNLGIDTDKWMFLTGEKDIIREMALKYFVAVVEDEEAPGGLDHSGKMVVVDKSGHVRAFAEGTDPDDVTELLNEIDILLAEYQDTK